MSVLTHKLSILIRAMEDLKGEIQGSLSNLDTDEQVAVGQRLNAIVKITTDTLDPIKAVLRDQAVQRTKGASGPCKLEAPDGSECTIRIPTPSVELRKNADISNLRTQLGILFDSLIETVTTYKPRTDIRVKTAAIPDPAQKQALLEALEISPGTPKVFFKA